jgi:hypothetical protein
MDARVTHTDVPIAKENFSYTMQAVIRLEH